VAESTEEAALALTTGQRVTFDDLGVEVFVVSGGDATLTAELRPSGPGLAIGKRFESADGVVVLVTKKGDAVSLCDGAEMLLQAPKATKSGD
jgi:hypothetical protein